MAHCTIRSLEWSAHYSLRITKELQSSTVWPLLSWIIVVPNLKIVTITARLQRMFYIPPHMWGCWLPTYIRVVFFVEGLCPIGLLLLVSIQLHLLQCILYLAIAWTTRNTVTLANRNLAQCLLGTEFNITITTQHTQCNITWFTCCTYVLPTYRLGQRESSCKGLLSNNMYIGYRLITLL